MPERTDSALSERRILAPRIDWTHRACPTCGEVYQWPRSRLDEPTFCAHDGKLNFGSTIQVDETWTQTVPVEVVRR